MPKYLMTLHGRITILFLICGLQVLSQDVRIIPLPKQLQPGNGQFMLSSKTKIHYDPSMKNEALYLQRILKSEHKLSLATIPSRGLSLTNAIELKKTQQSSSKQIDEGYTLNVDTNNILITSNSNAGVFYGIQSLRQAISGKSIACMTIIDSPRFSWRAFMLDEGRYFKGKQVVKDIFDEMARLKMNVFHWHLTDDGGWRIEIKKYPKLTEIGSKRRMSELGTWLSNKFDSIPHSGYYTQKEIKELVEYANKLHISIIPEIEMPGHASAAIASYPWLGAENKQIEVPISFGIKQDVFNVTDPKVIQFLHDVLDEMMELFPSKIVHIGGDEVKYDQWKASKKVQEYMQQNNIASPGDLQLYFTNGISRYLEQKGHRMIGWNDILGGLHGNNDSTDAQVKDKLSENTIVQFWTGDPEIVTRAALKGHDVVNSYWLNTYLDYDYKSHPLESVYKFEPVPASLPSNMQHKILGIGAQMWGEWIPGVEDMNYKIYPRIAALAEVAWTEKEKKNYEAFKASLQHYFIPAWKKKGIDILPVQLATPQPEK